LINIYFLNISVISLAVAYGLFTCKKPWAVVRVKLFVMRLSVIHG